MTTVQFFFLCSHLNLGVYLPLLFFSSLFKLSSFLCPPHFTCLAFCLSLAFSLTRLNLYYDIYFSSLRKQARGFGTLERGSYIGFYLLPASTYTAFSSSQQRWANPELWWLLSPLLCGHRRADMGICLLWLPNHTGTLSSLCPEQDHKSRDVAYTGEASDRSLRVGSYLVSTFFSLPTRMQKF